ASKLHTASFFQSRPADQPSRPGLAFFGGSSHPWLEKFDTSPFVLTALNWFSQTTLIRLRHLLPSDGRRAADARAARPSPFTSQGPCRISQSVPAPSRCSPCWWRS